jgi:protein O-GlcNAc transferase
MFVHLIEQHDRTLFEVIGLSFGPDDKSSMRARLEKGFDRFLDIRKLTDLEIAKLIQREEIDILVDLVGYTGGNRAQILTFRPAPVQANFQGFGLGGPHIDYTFSDPQTTPDRLLEETYREKVVRLPDTWVSTDPVQAIAEATPSRADEGLPEHGFVFCSFNGPYKINPPMFDVWMRLLAAVPDSVLWLRYENQDAVENLRSSAERRGVAPDRLVFARRIGLPEHLARHRLADLFIDTFPYGAHTTASHALWAGLPVLTQRGETFVSRVSASILHAIGLPELVTDSSTAYETRALELARDPGQLEVLRQKLARQRLTAPLFDSERFGRHVDRAYVEMFERWRRGEPPVSFDVAAVD